MDVFDLVAKITLDSKDYDAKLSAAAAKFGDAGQRISAEAQKMQVGFLKATMAGGAAVAAFGLASLKTGAQFDKAMSQVAATMGTTVDQIQDLRQFALQMGKTTAFSATEAADALNYMALAGYDAQTSMEMLPNVLNLAAAGAMDLATASDMITDSQTALGLTLGQTNDLVDQMAVTASKTNTSVSQLGDAILTVGGTAQFMAGGTTELNSVLGVLADNSIKGSEGGTHLRNILLSLSSPTADAAKTLGDLGVAIFDAEGNMRSFSEIFPELNSAMETLTDQQKLDAISTIFNTRDIASVNALLGTSVERWDELGAAIEDSTGAAERMANTQLDNLAGDVTLLKSAFEGLQIELSDRLTPVARTAVQGLTGLIENIDGVVGALGPAIAGFAAFSVAINITSILGTVMTKLSAFYTLLAANPIGLAIALTAGLAVAVYNLATHFGELYTKADAAAEGIRNLNRATESSVSAYAEADKAAGEAVNNIKGKVSQMATETVARMGEGGTEGGNQYKANLIAQLNDIDPQMAAVVESAMSNSAALAGTYGTDGGTQYADGFVQGAEQLEGTISTATENEMSAANAAAQAGAAQATSSGAAFGNNLTSGLQSSAGKMISAASSAVSSAVAAARGAASGASSIGAQIANGIAGGIRSAAANVASAAVATVKAALTAAQAAAAIQSPSKLFRDEVGWYMGLGVAEGLEKSEDKVIQNAVKLAQDTYSAAQEWIRRNAKFQGWSLGDQIAAWQDVQAGFVEGSKQYLDAEEKIFDLRREMADKYYSDSRKAIERDIKFNKRSLSEQYIAWRDLQKQYSKTSEEYMELEEKIFDLREDLLSHYQSEATRLWENIENAAEKYADAVDKRAEQIAGAYGLFDDVQDRSRISGQALVTNLTRQVNVMTSFYSELEKLAERGASEKMVEEIREMGPQAVDQLDALLSMTDGQFEKYVSLYEQKQSLANSVAIKELKTLKGEMEEEINAQKKALIDLYNATAPGIGAAFTDGLSDGIRRGMSSVINAVNEVAKRAIEAARSALGIHSPSKVFAGIGEMMAEGLAQGWEKNIGAVEGEIRKSLKFQMGSVDFAQSGLGASSAGIINSVVGQAAQQTGGTYQINLVTPEGGVMARWL
ncbi:MAG: phage tail tape measure protein, partial [Deltaproteobacteria bacterium]|nr:phage tail tape measure protein [Deltaproteobacteria bacterium]